MKEEGEGEGEKKEEGRRETSSERRRRLKEVGQEEEEKVLWIDRIQSERSRMEKDRGRRRYEYRYTTHHRQEEEDHPPSSVSSSSSSFQSTTSHLTHQDPSTGFIHRSSLTSSSSLSLHSLFSTHPPIHSSTTIQSDPPPSSTHPLNSDHLQRLKSIQELIQTESNYTSDLLIIQDIYLLHSTGPPPLPPPISTHDRLTIFSNIIQLTRLARSLSDHLIRAHSINQIGLCFLQFLPRIEKHFTIYCSKYDSARKRLEQLIQISNRSQRLRDLGRFDRLSSSIQTSSKRPSSDHGHPLLQYLENCQSLSQGKTCAWDLGSLLIKPVQRCLKYSLLLDQIIKYTHPTDPDLINLLNARDGMLRVAESINENKRRHELMSQVINRSIATKYAVRLVVPQRNSDWKWNTPPELIDSIGRVKRTSKALRALVIGLKDSDRSIHHWFLSAHRLVEAFKSVYLLNSSPDDQDQAKVDHLDRYQRLALRGALDGPFLYLHQLLKSTIIPKIEELIGLYSKPIKLIEKYKRRKQLIATIEVTDDRENADEDDDRPPISPSSTKTITTTTSSPRISSSSIHSHPTVATSGNNGAADERIVDEVREIESFLIDQLPRLIHASDLTFRALLALLAQSYRLFQADLIVLIQKSRVAQV